MLEDKIIHSISDDLSWRRPRLKDKFIYSFVHSVGGG
jgi:hypothetical protein